MKINLLATVPFVYYPKRKARGDHMYSTTLFYIQNQVWWSHSVLILRYDPDNKQRIFSDTALNG